MCIVALRAAATHKSNIDPYCGSSQHAMPPPPPPRHPPAREHPYTSKSTVQMPPQHRKYLANTALHTHARRPPRRTCATETETLQGYQHITETPRHHHTVTDMPPIHHPLTKTQPKKHTLHKNMTNVPRHVGPTSAQHGLKGTQQQLNMA